MKHTFYFLVITTCLILSFAPLCAADDQAAQDDGQTVSLSGDESGREAEKTSDRAWASPYDDDYDDDEYDYEDEPFSEERVTIADPLEPANRAASIFNDRMYFWVLKPVASAYKFVTPEPARISVKNFFFHLGYPARFLNCLLQTDFAGAGEETGRFIINTIWGIGGLMDPAAGKKSIFRNRTQTWARRWVSMEWDMVFISSGRFSGHRVRVTAQASSTIIYCIPLLTSAPGMPPPRLPFLTTSTAPR